MAIKSAARAMALVAVLAFGSLTLGAQQSLQDLMARAQSLVDRAEYSNLLELSTRIITAYPASSEAYRYRGLAKRNLKDMGGAIADYDRAIKLDPSNVRAWRGRGATKRGAGEFITDRMLPKNNPLDSNVITGWWNARNARQSERSQNL